MLMIVLDVTVVNVALPSIQDDLGFSSSSLAWVVNAYLIAFGGLLLLAGRCGDLIGRRTLFMAGLGIFTVASLLCGSHKARGPGRRRERLGCCADERLSPGVLGRRRARGDGHRDRRRRAPAVLGRRRPTSA
jgi:hypothetical protein